MSNSTISCVNDFEDLDLDEKALNDFVKSYNKLNNRFRKKCVFAVGHSAGFFSEINNMIFAMLYCLENEIKFIPYTKDSNFSDKKGWQEFFEPFCKEFSPTIKRKFNHRSINDIEIIYKNRQSEFSKFKLWEKYFKIIHRISYLTHEIWPKFNENLYSRTFRIENLGIEGDCFEAGKKLARMIWRFNEPTKKDIKNIIDSLNLPKEYVAIHIRAGDKIVEVATVAGAKLISEDIFMEKIKEMSTLKDVFVFADDYRQIEKFKNVYPDYHFYTLCKEDERGYFNEQFQVLCWDEKKPKLLNLFANVEICLKANLFIGTRQANPDYFMKMFMDKSRIEVIPYIP